MTRRSSRVTTPPASPGDTIGKAARPGPDMIVHAKTLTEFIIGEQRKFPHATGDFTALVSDLGLACKRIAYLVSKGALAGSLGKAGTTNIHGDEQATLDVLANEIFLRTNEWGGSLAGMASEELDEPYRIPDEYPRGRYLLAFDPLDGSSNIDVNQSVGSIFSVVPCPEGVSEPDEAAFLQPGVRQVCAGYAIYGPSTMLVLTFGRGVHGFTLDLEIGEFTLTHPNLRVPEQTSEFAINSSNARFWEPAVVRYVDECLAGRSGVRGKDFTMRWVASLVAEAHRILMRGGVFLYPRDTREDGRRGKLRLLYEVNPIGFLIEQAGGRASTGDGPILEIQPQQLHQRAGLVFGARAEVERIEQYHRDHNEPRYDAPLFGSRGLFRDES
jgi:fructose-1,6-bisphosphatase I/sedoheptulose-1,7-bisphosphatase